jgi:hypothetical protein
MSTPTNNNLTVSCVVDSTANAKDLHKRLASLIFDKADRFRKRHGKWMRLRLNNNYFLEMDSWNKSIKIKRGTGEPRHPNTSDVGGFKGKELHYFGMDFGGYEVPKSQHMGVFWIYTAFYTN